MPVISAFADHPTHPYVRVEVNWADTPSVQYAGVYRVDVETGECTPLRPYICYNGWELLLSCGVGVFWDTEAPFNREFYYITASSEAPCLSQSTLVYTAFDTPLVNSWGSTESGTLGALAWANSGGTVPGNYDVSGGSGLHTLDSTNVFRTSVVDIGQPDFDIHFQASVPVVASGAAIPLRALGRFLDVNNTYLGGLQFETTGLVTASLAKIVGGVGSLIGSASSGAYLAGQVWNARFQGIGDQFRLKVWADGSTEPTAWAVTGTDTEATLAANTSVGLSSRANTGNANGTFAAAYPLFEVIDECVPCEPVTAGPTDTLSLDPDGTFWLKDPVRPCHDRPVPLCQTEGIPPTCGGDGILFVGMGPEVYGANSYSLRPANRRRSISATRPRSDATTALRLQTLTFTDRDDLLQLAAPGSPLLFHGPDEYGVPMRYMDVRDVQLASELPDLRIQIRSAVLPYETVDRPAGPTEGICGARVADICALFPTWGDLAASGFTWGDLPAGQASPESANPDRRTWNDVNAEFADWDAVNTGGRTWNDLYEGE
jgi:hypothetical protein